MVVEAEGGVEEEAAEDGVEAAAVKALRRTIVAVVRAVAEEAEEDPRTAEEMPH